MRPYVRAALIATTVLVVVRFAERARAPDSPVSSSLAEASSSSLQAVPCPAASVPDDGACIPLPALAPSAGAHRGSSEDDAIQAHEYIPRRTDRPPEYDRYRFPVPVTAGENGVTNGLDLGSLAGQRTAEFDALGGGLYIAAARGTAVRLVAFERQVGLPEVLFTGELFGTTVITLHRVREATERQYVALFGGLERAAKGTHHGAALDNDAVLGFVGTSGQPGMGRLRLEVRRVRDGVNVHQLTPRELIQPAQTITVDPRNVLSLR